MAAVLRQTKQKQAIYDALAALDHPTATEVYERVHTEHPAISRGTVFRVLGGFAEQGRIRRLALTGSDTRFDPTLAPHAHGVCRVCGRVCDVFLPALASFEPGRICDGFQAEDCEVQFTGVCGQCRRETMRASAQK